MPVQAQCGGGAAAEAHWHVHCLGVAPVTAAVGAVHTVTGRDDVHYHRWLRRLRVGPAVLDSSLPALADFYRLLFGLYIPTREAVDGT